MSYYYFLKICPTRRKVIWNQKVVGFETASNILTFFALKLLIIVFSKLESTAHSLQYPKLSLTQAQSVIDVLSVVLNTVRNEQKFYEMWAAVVQEAVTIDVEEPVIQRRIRCPPRRLDEEA